MSFVKSGVMALALSVAALSPQFTLAQAVSVSGDSLQATIASCSQADPAVCATAIQVALNALAAANPGVPVESLLGALMAEVASAGNAAVATGNTQLAAAMAAAAGALSTAASSAGVAPSIIATYQQVAAAFASNQAVDLPQVNGVTNTLGAAPNVQASPF